MRVSYIFQYILFLLCSLYSVQSQAADSSDKLVNLTLSDGLAGETVHRVMTDHNGYVWIATTGGISVYNGKYLMTFRLLNNKGRTLEVTDLCETRDLSVYAATEEGVYRMTKTSHQFERVMPEVTHPLSLLAVGDTVYIGSEQGLQYWDGRQLHRQDVGIGRKGLDNIVRHYVHDDKGFIWFLGRHDLNRYDPRTNKISHYDLVSVMGGRNALSQFDISGGKFFIGTRNNGLFVYDPQTKTARHLDSVGRIVISVRKSADGRIAVATDGTGACLVDPVNEQVVERFSMNETGIHRLPTNALYSFYRDANGVNWLGTVRGGLFFNPHNSRLFKAYEQNGLSSLGMNVRCFAIHGSQVVLGLQDGMWLMDSDRHQQRYFSPEEMGGHIVNNIKKWHDYYVIGIYDGGIRLLDARKGTLSRQTWSPLLDRATIGDIKVAPDSSLWIGCSDGLFIIHQDGRVRQLTEQNSHIIGGIIISITFDREGNAWLTGAEGLSLYSAKSQDIVEPSYPEGFFGDEPYMRGILGHHGMIFMRNGPQLFYTTPQMNQFGELKLPVHLSDKWCRSMVDNQHGRLWLASERGLLSVDYQGKNLMQFGEGEGLLGDQISEVMIGDDSRLWVATNQGLFSTSQEELQQWLKGQKNKVTLYNVRKGSDLISRDEMSLLSEHHEIRLSWNFTSEVLQADPLLLDYARQKDRIYEYRVDGGDWILLDIGASIDVRHLLMGHHLLTVRQAGIEGTETVYTLYVIPSVWAIFELVLLIIAIILLYMWWVYRKNTRRLLSERNEIENALIEVEEELQAAEKVKTEDVQKYQKVRLDEKESAEIVRRMKDYIEKERVYTNADLKMKDLADVLHLSAPKLSQVFNLYLKENYYEFINRYRLEEFKRLIEAGEYKQYTITALSEKCGFKKSNFFSTFRKVEGMTPAEYLKKQGIKV